MDLLILSGTLAYKHFALFLSIIYEEELQLYNPPFYFDILQYALFKLDKLQLRRKYS